MRSDAFDLTGIRFGRLTVIDVAPDGKCGARRWNCICDCGNSATVFQNGLRSKRQPTQSCGCLITEARRKRPDIHGLTKLPEYRTWRAMCTRCKWPKHENYKHYGGRGIRICERWSKFVNFLADMGPRPFKDAQIERKDNDGDYEPGNCIWTTAEVNSNNRPGFNHYLEYDGLKLSVSQWAKRLGWPRSRVQNRVRMGWPVERILTSPPVDPATLPQCQPRIKKAVLSQEKNGL